MLCGHNHSYSYREAGTIDGNTFPILVNSNNDRVEVKVTAKEIKMQVKEATGKTLHEKTIAVK